MATRPALLDIGTQRDFMVPGGSLYIRGVEVIFPNLLRLLRWGADEKRVRLASVDAHPPDSREFQQWTPHGVHGTEGQRKITATDVKGSLIIPDRKLEALPALSVPGEIIFETDDVDLFSNPNVEPAIAALALKEFILFGVSTENGVRSAGLGLLKRGFKVRLVTDAVCAIDAKAGERTLEELASAGARLVTTAQVVTPKPRRSPSSR